MKISIPKETIHDETRVAATPQSVKELIKAGMRLTLKLALGLVHLFLTTILKMLELTL